MFDILSFLPHKRKHSSSGWYSFNAVCCHHNGNTQDKRGRGGVKLSADGGFGYSCFNCGYTAGFVPGKSLTYKTRKLLEWLNVDAEVIEQINLDSLRYRVMNGLITTQRKEIKPVNFEERELPAGFELIDPSNPRHNAYYEYLCSRSVNPDGYPYRVSPDSEDRQGKSILIPFTHKGVVVGNTIRFMDARAPKYISDSQPGYVFGLDLQQTSWQHLFVVEGVFDALSINAVAVLHNDINDVQAQIIRASGKQITVIPDYDQAGLALIAKAVELGWPVSFPEWPDGVKDVNDAVKIMGRLATVLTILQSRETIKGKIIIKGRELAKRI